MAVFAITLGVGNAVGSVSEPPPRHDEAHDDGGHEGMTTDGAADIPGGLMVSQDGYTLQLADQQAPPGVGVPISFTITGPDGHPVTAYDVEHEKQLHLIAVRRDFSGFQHVHPVLGAGRHLDDGARPDLGPVARLRRLQGDRSRRAHARRRPRRQRRLPSRPTVPTESRTSDVDGYTVTIAGDLDAGADAELTLSVTRDGTPVTDLEPYLGAYGHLVALRAGDLAYLHVHPDGAPGDGTTEPGPDVVFYAAVPSAGSLPPLPGLQAPGRGPDRGVRPGDLGRRTRSTSHE